MRRIPGSMLTVGRIVVLVALAVAYYFIHQNRWSSPDNAAVVPAPDSTATAPEPRLLVFEHTVAPGQTLAQILNSSIVEPADIIPALESLRRIFDPRRLRPGRPVQLLVDSSGALHELSYQASPELRVRVQREESGDFLSRLDSLRVVPEIFIMAGEIHSTLYDAVLAGDESPELLLAYTDIFQWDLDFFIEVRRGDRFRMLFEKLYVVKDDGTRAFVRYGRILGATYEQAGTSLFACFFQDSTGRSGYFDRNGHSFQKTFLKSPLNYRRISSHFSHGRRHPILKKVRAHTGVDFVAPIGTPVTATAEGTVAALGWDGGYGNRVLLSHKNHFTTLYGHLSKYAAGLQVGDQVKQGQVVGYVGATGLATGPHLHYTMYLNGRAINPLRLRPAAADPVAPRYLADFQRHRDQLEQWLAHPPLTLEARPLYEVYSGDTLAGAVD